MENDELKNMAIKIQNSILDVAEKVANKIKQKLIKETIDALDANDKNVTGVLRKSIEGEVLREVNKIVLEITANTAYAKFVHDGTGPAVGHAKYYPPIYPIYYWVKRRGLADNFRKFRKGRGSRTQQAFDNYDAAMKVAKQIAWKIYQKGTVGFKFFEIALKQSTPFIEEEIAKIKI